MLVLRAIPIPFHSTDCFQDRHVEEGSGDLGPLYMNLYGTLNRANEIAGHISEVIMADAPRDRRQEHSGGSFSCYHGW